MDVLDEQVYSQAKGMEEKSQEIKQTTISCHPIASQRRRTQEKKKIYPERQDVSTWRIWSEKRGRSRWRNLGSSFSHKSIETDRIRAMEDGIKNSKRWGQAGMALVLGNQKESFKAQGKAKSKEELTMIMIKTMYHH